ncbi:hypothetical protein [Paractinoplanes brasiliensis]|uniref:Uncharacterized protein n=1 Tax=Paractinoplanes brasiliensis TaxID=52695 RepID=A0A4R6JL68_9ACTN|nr:hypothetical protein [Actinoplanes brasiliensis]TDO36452.1 hypothetical protein C8E87_0022 [Actinoplanes brasiliensis]GID32504.1 hypothetical protein Abr02nite_74870 [Actinoplanes brasiliensis]
MDVDALRNGWPAAVLSGRYTFRTRRRDDLAESLADVVREVSMDALNPRTSKQLHVCVAGRPVMAVLRNPAARRTQLPPGPKLYQFDPPGPLLTLLSRDDPAVPLSHPTGAFGWLTWWAAGHRAPTAAHPGSRAARVRARTVDVLDNRLNVIIGRLQLTDGPLMRARIRIHDPAGRLLGEMRETAASSVRSWLPMNSKAGAARFTFTVDGQPVAQIRQRFRAWHYTYEFDVTRLAGRLDPRLVLACGVRQLAYHSTY